MWRESQCLLLNRGGVSWKDPPGIGEALGIPGGAGRFIPRTMNRCISVLLSSEKILLPGNKEKEPKVKEHGQKGPLFQCLPAY